METWSGAPNEEVKLFWSRTDPMHNDEVVHMQQCTRFPQSSCEGTDSGSFTKPLDVHGFCHSCLPVQPGGQASRLDSNINGKRRVNKKKRGAH